MGGMAKTLISCLLLALLAGAGGAGAQEAARYGYKVIQAYPHDKGAFTQGLLYHQGDLYEGTGQHGESSLRRVRLETGEVLQKRALPKRYFGEGIAIVGERIYQLTWRARRVFVYDLQSFASAGLRRIATEGWGLAYDGRSLILSDGSAQLQFLDPETFAVQRRVEARLDGAPVAQLNELEFIQGEVWANVWQTARLVRINPADGRVTGVVDLAGLERRTPFGKNPGVLNGIAWDPEGQRLFVTGKRWANLFHIELVPR